jgi:hypothetical protein
MNKDGSRQMGALDYIINKESVFIRKGRRHANLHLRDRAFVFEIYYQMNTFEKSNLKKPISIK